MARQAGCPHRAPTRWAPLARSHVPAERSSTPCASRDLDSSADSLRFIASNHLLARRLRRGARRRRGRRGGRRFRQDRVRYSTPPLAESLLAAPVRGHPPRSLRPPQVTLTVLPPATRRCAVAAARPHRSARRAEHVNLAADPAPPEPTVQRPAAPSRSGWTRVPIGTRLPLGARDLDARATKARVIRPGPSPFRPTRSTSSTPAWAKRPVERAMPRARSCRGLGGDHHANGSSAYARRLVVVVPDVDEEQRSPSGDFVRCGRLAVIVDSRTRAFTRSTVARDGWLRPSA